MYENLKVGFQGSYNLDDSSLSLFLCSSGNRKYKTLNSSNLFILHSSY